ncbi:unnamed protein product [Spirodela intermedia]|uniref:Uncharacterized protein n=2 Tax=Spirodela intermedia TaxID=51605 RepID=A0A7I8IQL1_SPIIN|nr:unnamed protein product [Spirodela intermedia]CAA6660209.1 unnamed protein product [Spirodela intermedia]CAA7396535.1 unnamed protein product [Spirodela intermedia]
MDSRVLPSFTSTSSHPSFPSIAHRPLSLSFPARLLRSGSRVSAPSSQGAQSSRQGHPFHGSLPIHSKNPHAVCKDIQRLARQGRLKEALTLLDYFEQRGVPVNATTFSCLLSACARLKSLSEGRQIHAHIRINGLERNEFLLTKLVQMYASCGSPEYAQKIFSDLSPENVYTWNALLRGSVVGGRRWSHRTLSAFSEMREKGVDPNAYSFSCLIKSLAGSPSPVQGMKAHALMIKKGLLHSSEMLRTSLIDMYFKCRKIRMALKLFDESPHRDVVLWGAVIAGFSHNGLWREALEYLRWMTRHGVAPNSVILATVLPVAGELGDQKLGRELHGYAMKYFRDFQKWPFIHSALVDMYCKCGDMASGRRVFYGCATRTAVSWTALMAGYISNGRLEQALRAIVWMQQEGLKPDVVSVATVLPVCAKLRVLKQGKEIHGYALKNGFLPNISIATSLMTMYSSCGSLQYSCRVFAGLQRRNVIAWTAMIDSFVKNGRPHAALDIFRSMLLSDRKHRPDYVSMGRILRICGELGALKLGKEIHAQVLRRRLEWIPLVAAELVTMYGKCGVVETARALFDQVGSKGSLTWTSIIEAYGINGRNEDALGLFDLMLSSGFAPNRFTFDVVLSVCENAGLTVEALKAFDILTGRFNLKPSEGQYDCIIGLLDRSGRREEAQRFLLLRSAAGGRPLCEVNAKSEPIVCSTLPAS